MSGWVVRTALRCCMQRRLCHRVQRRFWTNPRCKTITPTKLRKSSSPFAAFSPRRTGLSVTFVSKTGAAADTIAQVAEKGKFDLIVMGSHGMSSLKNLVMGSVATKVLAHCDVPVLLIR